jgi:hypothetical protein
VQVVIRELAAMQQLSHLHQKIKHWGEDKWVQKVLVLLDSARPHTSCQITQMACRVVSVSHCILYQKISLLHPSGSYQKNGNSALTSVGYINNVPKYDYVAVIISQPIFQASSVISD